MVNGGTSELRSTRPNCCLPLDASTGGGDPSDLSAKRTSENLNTLCISCFASQRCFLQKSNKKNNHNSKRTCHTNFSHSASQLAYPKTYMCRLSSLFIHFFPLQIDFFFFFLLWGVKQTAKNFTFC